MDIFTRHMLGFSFAMIAVMAVALAILNLPAFLKLASSIAGAVMDGLRWIASHKQAALCITLALLAGYGFLQTYRANQTIVVVRTEAKAAADKCKADIADLDNTIGGYKAQQKAFADASREQAKALDNAQNQSAEALANVARLQAQAEANNAGWWKTYNARPQSCKAALEALDVACDSIGKDY